MTLVAIASRKEWKMGTVVRKKHLLVLNLQDLFDEFLTIAIGALSWILSLASIALLIQ